MGFVIKVKKKNYRDGRKQSKVNNYIQRREGGIDIDEIT